MDSAEAPRRNLLFALALAILVAGAIAMSLLGHAEGGARFAQGARTTQGARQGESDRGAEVREARLSARRFLGAYLRYEAGRLGGEDRESLRRYSTPSLGSQLLRAPVRVPPGSHPPRQLMARIAAVQATLFDGRAGLLLSVVVAGRTGTHLLRASLLKRRDRWVVAGIGP